MQISLGKREVVNTFYNLQLSGGKGIYIILFRNFPYKIEKWDFYSRKERTIPPQYVDL